MPKNMLVNVTHVEESRVAITDDGVLAAYEIETLNRTSIKGNIYNAVVEATHPSLEAAFLRVAPGLKGFLPLDEVNFKLLPSRRDRGSGGRIGQHLHADQRLMVQVVREPFGGKPPSVSTYFSLPGRYLVLMPGVDSAGVSRRIEDSSQRERLKKIIDELKPPEGFGLIVRTAGLGQTKTELQRDLRYLLRLWESIQRASEATDFPGLVYREQDLIIRTIRDHFTPDISEVWIDSKDTYERALEFVKDVMPTKAKTLRLYTGERPLFNKFNLEEQIESIYKRRVSLPSGGEIVIDGTEALTAIDVNTSRSQRKGDAEERVTQTNVEAASEISRQLRLRDLGGLVVVDFIDMQSRRNQKKVEKAMRDAMKGDRAKYDVTPISKLGLLEIARQRLKSAKLAATYTACPACEGYGLVKNVEAAALAALRKLQTRTAKGDAGSIRMTVPPEVAVWILNNKREELHVLERRHDLRIDVVPQPSLLRHEARFETAPREKKPEAAEARPAPPREPRPEPAAAAPAEPAKDAAAKDSRDEPATTTGRRRRRRRRRHSRAGVLAGGDEAAVARKSRPPEEQKAEAAADDGAPKADPKAAGAAASGDEAQPARKRRRRRRRRRPASSGEGGNGADRSTGDRNADQPEAPAANVPEGVESNELMPAAAGGGRSRRKPRPAGRSRKD